MSKLLLLPLIISLFLIISVSVFAEQTVKTIQIPIGYVAQTTAGTDYIQTITIKPPDGVQDIISFELFVQGDFQASTNLKARVRKTGGSTIFDCTPNTWTTPNIDTANYEASYDCSDLADEYEFMTGKIDVGFRTSKIARNVKGFARMTYYNKPKISIQLHGTEYQITDTTAKTFLQLLDDNKQIVENSSCFSAVYYPDATIMFNYSLMAYVGDGLYQQDFAPYNQTLQVGIYMVSAYCIVPEAAHENATDDFECGGYDCGTGWSGNWTRNSTTVSVSTSYSPIGSYHIVSEGTTNTEAQINRTVDLSEITGTSYLSFWTKVISVGTDDWCNYDYYNGSSWTTLLSLTDGDDDEIYHYYSFDLSSYGYSANSAIRLHTYLDSSDICTMDNITFSTFGLSNTTEYQTVRGSGEMHVSNWFNKTEFAEKVWEYPTRNLTYYPKFDYEQMAQYVWNFSNRTVNLTETMEEMRRVNSSIFTKLHMIQDDIENLNNLSAEEVWTYGNRTVNLTEILDFLYAMNASIHLRLDEIEQIILDFNASIHIEIDNLANITAEDVWTYYNRTLTETFNLTCPECNLSEVLNSLININNSLGENVWSYYNRTLTDYNQSELIALLNQTQNFILNLNNLSASNVWEYPLRNLTYINFTEVLDRIDLANSTIITEILSSNASIWSKLFLIQDELAYINTTTIDTNYWVKQNNILLYNISIGNITVYASLNWTALQEAVWNKTSPYKLKHDVLSLADDEIQLVTSYQYCKDNTTLVVSHNVTRCILGYCINETLTETTTCTYGCYNNECRQPPWVITLIVFILILVISAMIFYFSPKDEMT